MVHLAKVKTDQSIADSKLPELEGLNLGPSPGQDEFTASVSPPKTCPSMRCPTTRCPVRSHTA
jgi:hypothetical protein